MKKHYIALAITSAFAAPAAFADVEVGSFAIYGSLNSAIEFINVESNGAVLANTDVSQTRLADQSSRLGFKIKHDLGNGVFGIGQVESRLYLGNNGNNTDDKAELGSRNTFLGLGSSTLGTVRLGRYDNAYKLSSKLLGPLRDNLNDASDDTGDKQILNRLGARQGDSVAYESPNWGGVTFIASYNLGKDSTNSISGGAANNTAKNTVATDLMTQFSAGLGYKAGAFSVGVGTTSLNNAAWQLDASSAAKATNSAGAKSLQAWQIGAGYTFGEFKVGVVSERTNSSLSGAASFDQYQTSTGLVGAYLSGPISAELRYAIADDVSGTTNGAATAVDTGATQLGIALGYQLHKNVKLVGSYTRIDNRKNASYTTFSGFTLGKGVDMNQLALGVSVGF